MPELSKEFDPSRAHSGRVHDFLLGGKDHYSADTMVGEQLLADASELQVVARAARRFLVRAVRTLADLGIYQFVELGSGYPCNPNLHEVVRAVASGARTLYVDNDPVVAAHGRALLADAQTSFIHADLTDTTTIANAIDTALDSAVPIAVCLGFVLEFIDDPAAVVQALITGLPTGSYVVLSHITGDIDADIAERAAGIYSQHDIRFTPRTRADIAAMLTGCEVIEPGVVGPHRWRPDDDLNRLRTQRTDWPPPRAAEVCCYAAVGRVR